MEPKKGSSETTLGFLSVTEHPQFGLFGGYLVLNAFGRPLEFHCTAPLKPNRAQEILYGPTLEEFIFGEQIGRTLIEQSGPPLIVFTDRRPALAARQYVSPPLALVLSPSVAGGGTQSTDDDEKIYRIDAAHEGRPRLAHFRYGRNRLALPERADEDRRLIVERLSGVDESFDLFEPFGRIYEAIEEARQAAR
ncbi:MAG: hypothetical protein JW959_14515 [Pirellulales bacterium]|nr:hypothetical protein [Pirellulales bacterium]